MYTAYAIAKIINDQLVAQGYSDLQIRPQMMYNYGRNGLIVQGVKDSTYRYSQAEADAFVSKFVPNRIAKTAKATPAPQTVEDIEAQIAKLEALKAEMIAQTEKIAQVEQDMYGLTDQNA